jgi:ribosomal protein S18 acetylase RimI-like enzyme
MSKSGFVPDIVQLGPADWYVLRELRLSALLDSPHVFLSTYKREYTYPEEQWLAELSHNDWYCARVDAEPVSLMCVTREAGSERSYLESLWVSPKFRSAGLGYLLLTTVLGKLRAAGVSTAFLWVLDGNEAAMRLYKRVGFVNSNRREELKAHPGRTEEEMLIHLVDREWP